MLFRKITLAVPLCAIALAIAPCAFAQMSGPAANASPAEASASESMQRAGESAESAMTHAYQGTKTAVKDTTITARIKSAIHSDKSMRSSDIHVDTVAGVVTLSGSAPTAEAATHAQEIAQRTKGVRSVKNDITLAAENSSMR